MASSGCSSAAASLQLLEHVGQRRDFVGQLALLLGESLLVGSGPLFRLAWLLEGLAQLSLGLGDRLGEVPLPCQPVGQLPGFERTDLARDRLQFAGGRAGFLGGLGFAARLDRPARFLHRLGRGVQPADGQLGQRFRPAAASVAEPARLPGRPPFSARLRRAACELVVAPAGRALPPLRPWPRSPRRTLARAWPAPGGPLPARQVSFSSAGGRRIFWTCCRSNWPAGARLARVDLRQEPLEVSAGADQPFEGRSPRAAGRWQRLSHPAIVSPIASQSTASSRAGTGPAIAFNPSENSAVAVGKLLLKCGQPHDRSVTDRSIPLQDERATQIDTLARDQLFEGQRPFARALLLRRTCTRAYKEGCRCSGAPKQLDAVLLDSYLQQMHSK